MAFVKLDTKVLDSTLWIHRDQREVFITALLMAEPFELTAPAPQLEGANSSIVETGFVVPPGWYGFVPAAGPGIVRRAGLNTEDEHRAGMEALKMLGQADPDSRSAEHEGRRLVRIDGGFLVLNYMKYRDKDHTAAQRQRRLRERRNGSHAVTSRSEPVISRIADADSRGIEKQQTLPAVGVPTGDGFIEFYAAYPRHEARARAERAWRKLAPDAALQQKILDAVTWQRRDGCLRPNTDAEGRSTVPHPASWLNARRWEDERQQRPGTAPAAQPADPAAVARQAALSDAQARWADVDTDAKLGLIGQRLEAYSARVRSAIAAVGGLEPLCNAQERPKLAGPFMRAYLAAAAQQPASA